MARVFVIGRITQDLEQKHSQRGLPFIRFNLAENISRNNFRRTQFYQVWAWGDDAAKLMNSQARKGSLIWIAGTLEQEVFTRKDGHTTDKRLKVYPADWGFAQSKSCLTETMDRQLMSVVNSTQPNVAEIDGDNEKWPE